MPCFLALNIALLNILLSFNIVSVFSPSVEVSPILVETFSSYGGGYFFLRVNFDIPKFDTLRQVKPIWNQQYCLRRYLKKLNINEFKASLFGNTWQRGLVRFSMCNTITLSFFSLMNFTLWLLTSSLNSSMNKDLQVLTLLLLKWKQHCWLGMIFHIIAWLQINQ